MMIFEEMYVGAGRLPDYERARRKAAEINMDVADNPLAVTTFEDTVMERRIERNMSRMRKDARLREVSQPYAAIMDMGRMEE